MSIYSYYTGYDGRSEDRWITGNWGEDAEKEPKPEYERDWKEELELRLERERDW